MVKGEKKIISNDTLLNIVKVSLSNIIKLLSGVFLSFLLPKTIGITDFGYYKTFTLYVVYIGLLHFGFCDGIYLKYGGKNYDELEKEKFRSFSGFLIILELMISVIVAGIAMVFLDGELRVIFACLSVMIISTNITVYYQIISQITNRFNELSLVNIVQSILITVSILALWVAYTFFEVSISYRVFTVIYVLINVLIAAWYIIFYRQITFGKRTKIVKQEVIDLIKLGFPLLVANLASSFILLIDRQFVNLLFDTETYAVYAFSYNMLGLISTALTAISTVIYPLMRRTDTHTLRAQYSKLNGYILIFVFLCLTAYFPLFWFVNWFLPKYSSSLPIFRIILPGLAFSSCVTIIMHNYYKNDVKEMEFFIKSIIVLVISAIANFVAYSIFKTTISISIASILVMLIWYILIEEYFIREYKTKWIKNFLYMIIMTGVFYGVTMIKVWYISMMVYIVVFVLVSAVFMLTSMTRRTLWKIH